MKRVEVLSVTGAIVSRPGKGRVYTLTEEIEKAINGKLENATDELIDVKVQAENLGQASTGGIALITLIYEVGGKSKQKGGDR